MRTKEQEQIVTQLIEKLHKVSDPQLFRDAVVDYNSKINLYTLCWTDEEKEEFFSQNPIIIKRKEHEVLKYVQQNIEETILACPSGNIRNFLTEINILLLEKLTIFVPKEGEKPT